MTEYGRGSGSEPWYPEDPLYGEQGGPHGYGAGGEAAHQGPWEQHPGGAQPYEQYTQYPQAPYSHYTSQTQQYQQPDPGPQYSSGQYPSDEHYGSGPYPGQQARYPQQSGQPPYYPGEGHHAPQQPYYPAYEEQRQSGQDGWEGYPTGGHPASRPEPAGRGHAQRGEQHAYPGAGHAAGGPPREGGNGGHGPGPDPETGWDPGPDQGESDFFAGRGEAEDDREGPRGRSGRRGRGGEAGRPPKPRRGRGGCACLVMALVLGGGGAGAVYWGYGQYQGRYSEPADFQGQGRGEVQVEIPRGIPVSEMGEILAEAGVVASSGAFVSAAGDNTSIQAGIYTLRQEMSAAAAVELLTDPAALNVLTIPEGLRAAEIYAAIDAELGLEEGAAEQAAEEADLGLPEWAGGDAEGFLFPARYDVGEDSTPEDILARMVERAQAEFTGINLKSAAESVGMTRHEILIIASLIQAEAQEAQEFGKVSRVIYNRLEITMPLQFDSTINYALGRSTLHTSVEDTKLDSPYNTYQEYGLPPGPIGNPGHQAIEAALNPTEGEWLYFVTVRPGETRFTHDLDEHEQNVADFNEAQAAQEDDE